MLISDYFSWLILGKILVCFLWGCPGAYVYHSGLAYINTPSLVLYGSKNRLITCERFALLDSRIPMWGVQLTALRPFYRMTRLGNNVRRQCQMNTLKRQRVEFFVVLGHFCPLTFLTTQKIKILKKKKNTWRYYHFTLVYHKWWSYDVWFLRYQAWQTNFLSFRTMFCPFTPLTTQKIKILKKMKKLLEYQKWKSYCPFTPLPPSLTTQRMKFWKKTPGDIIIFLKCTINENHMIYCSWHMKCTRQNVFVILGHFLPFYPPKSLKNKNFRKMKKMPGDIITLH